MENQPAIGSTVIIKGSSTNSPLVFPVGTICVVEKTSASLAKVSVGSDMRLAALIDIELYESAPTKAQLQELLKEAIKKGDELATFINDGEVSTASVRVLTEWDSFERKALPFATLEVTPMSASTSPSDQLYLAASKVAGNWFGGEINADVTGDFNELKTALEKYEPVKSGTRIA